MHVRFAPKADKSSHRSEMTRCAISDRTQRSKIRAYSITSSAMESSVGGISTPIARAVARLMMN
jgi:hypothetical protein